MSKRKLTRDQQMFIVSELACFATPQEVADSFYAAFGVSITRQAVQEYDPDGSKRRSVSRRLRLVHEEVRRHFVAEVARIGIAHRAYRLRRLQEICDYAEARDNLMLALQALRMAAEEVGDMHLDNRRHEPPAFPRLSRSECDPAIRDHIAYAIVTGRERAWAAGKGIKLEGTLRRPAKAERPSR